MPAGAPADLLLVPGTVRDAAPARGTGKAAAEQKLLDEAMECFPALLDPGWIWLMDRNYHGAPRIARMIRSTHVLARLKSDIPLKRTSAILPDGSYEAELSGNGVTVKVRVIEYWVDVEGRRQEMFCLVTDLMDWGDYPAPELAALYKWRWDGSETALREAKAPLRGAGPGTGPMLRSGSPDLVAQELAAWAAATGLARGVVLDAALAAVPAGKGRRAGLPVRPRDLSFARAVRAVLSAIRLGHACYQAVTSEMENTRTPSTGTGTAPASQVPLVLRARGTRGHRHPHRPRRHHHSQHPGLSSTNIAHPPERGPPGRGPGRSRRDTPASGMPAGRKLPTVTKTGTTHNRSNT